MIKADEEIRAPESYGTEDLPSIVRHPSIVARSASCGVSADGGAEARNGKNYIGLLHEETKEQRVAELSPEATYPILDQILSLVAAKLNRRSEAR